MEYIELKVTIGREELDMAEAELLGAGFDSLMIDDPADVQEIIENRDIYRYDYINDELTEGLERKPVITLYFEMNEEGEAQRKSAEALLTGFKTAELNETESDDQDWLYKWQEFFKPTKVTESLVVKPTWEEYEPRCDSETGTSEKVIEIDPGMAFGTGTHETTSMCLKALEKAFSGAYDDVTDCALETVLDVGCGSGILAIGAALLGAKDALGVEIDTDAVEIARENVELNKLSDRITIQYGDLTKGVDYKADIVVANLMADLVCMLTPDVASHLKQGGLYISSGILNKKEETVSKAVTKSGFEIVEVLHDGEWCAIVARRA